MQNMIALLELSPPTCEDTVWLLGQTFGGFTCEEGDINKPTLAHKMTLQVTVIKLKMFHGLAVSCDWQVVLGAAV